MIESPVKKDVEHGDASGQRLEDSQTPPHWRSDWDPDEDYFVYIFCQRLASGLSARATFLTEWPSFAGFTERRK